MADVARLTLAPAALVDLQRSHPPADAFGPGSDRPWLGVDLSTGATDSADLAGLAAWLPSLPCPVIGISDGQIGHPLAPACDAIVPHPRALAALTATIAAAPIAAMTLVQLLRIIGQLSADQGLTAESLAYGVLQAGPEFRAWLADRQRAPAPPREAGRAVEVDRQDSELVLTLNRPGNRNAMSMEMRDDLVEALQLPLLDESITRVSLSGRGKCFCVGGDLAEFGQAGDPASAHWVRSVRSPARAVLLGSGKLHVHVHGACVGSGVELASFAARVTASANSYFHMPELAMGLIPGSGGCVSLPARIGRQRTALLLLSGRRITAQTALEWGLVDALT